MFQQIEEDQTDLVMTTVELARELHISCVTLKKMERAKPDELPPSVLIARRRLYPRAAVGEWLLKKSGALPLATADRPEPVGIKKGPGRPRNTARATT